MFLFIKSGMPKNIMKVMFGAGTDLSGRYHFDILEYSSTFEYILNLVHAAPRLQVHLQPAAGLESVM